MAGTDILAGIVDPSSTYTTTGSAVGHADLWVSPRNAANNGIQTFSCSAGTADGAALYVNDILTAENLKFVVTDSSGNHLGITASTNVTGQTTPGWIVVDLVTPFAVSDSELISVWWAVFDGSGADYIEPFTDGVGFRLAYDNTGSFASPSDPMSNVDVRSPGRTAMRLMGTLSGGSTEIEGVEDTKTITSYAAAEIGIPQVVLSAANNTALVDATGAAVNVSGIIWEWYDTPGSTTGSPVDTGTLDTDASGEATFSIVGTSLADGEFGQLILYHPSDADVRATLRVPITVA